MITRMSWTSTPWSLGSRVSCICMCTQPVIQCRRGPQTIANIGCRQASHHRFPKLRPERLLLMAEPTPSPKIDTTVPHSARIWNYWMGGKDNFAADREAGDAYAATFPDIVTIAKESRKFLIRAVHYLAAEAGGRPFLDISTGLPRMGNTYGVPRRDA